MNDFDELVHRLSMAIYATDRWDYRPMTEDWYDIVERKYVSADEIIEVLTKVIELLCRG